VRVDPPGAGVYLDRYRAGACEQVWGELAAHGPITAGSPLHEQASAVAQETMRRVRANLLRLLPRLEQAGYLLGYYFYTRGKWSASTPLEEYATPVLGTPGLHSDIAALERAGLRLPLALRAFYTVIGAVNLTGVFLDADDQAALAAGTLDLEGLGRYHREQPFDPLYVYSLQEALRGALEDHQPLNTLVELPIHPDQLVKYNYAGVGSVYVALGHEPDPQLRFEGEETGVTFVGYLRECLRAGGLWDGDQALPGATHQALTEGLLPI
jgi:hypothetical protein